MQFKPFGVKLDFTPTMTAQGSIDLKVAPEVSSLDYANAVTLQGFTIPALSQRRAETEVVLKDGESFAIAGLIDNRVIEVMDKVPGLGNLPILGRLFQSRSTQKSTDELLVVITPHFVRPLSAGREGQAAGDAGGASCRRSRRRRAKKGKKSKAAAAAPAGTAGVCRTSWAADSKAVGRVGRAAGAGLDVAAVAHPPGSGDFRADGVCAGSGAALADSRGAEPGGERDGAGGGRQMRSGKT